MKPNVPAVALLVAGAFCLGRIGMAGDDRPKSVPAKKYRMAFAESLCDWIHGNAIPVHGLFLPEAKVSAYLEFRSDLGPDGHYRERPHLHARGADKADAAIPEKEGEQPRVEGIQLPGDLARQIEDYAALTRKYEEEGLRLGGEIRTRLGLEAIANRRQ